MKLRLTMDIEVSDENNLSLQDTEYAEAEIREMIFDAVTGFAANQHLYLCAEWIAKIDDLPAGIEPTPEAIERWNTNVRQLVSHHTSWADMLGGAKWKVYRLPIELPSLEEIEKEVAQDIRDDVGTDIYEDLTGVERCAESIAQRFLTRMRNLITCP